MKKKRVYWKRIPALAMALTMLLMLVGCGSSSKDMWEMATADSAPMKGGGTMSAGTAYNGAVAESWEEADYDYESPAEMVSPAVDNSTYFDNRKLIRTVNMDVETKEYDRMVSSVEEQVAQLGGYIEDMNSYNGSRYNTGRDPIRNANLTIRIPKQQLDAFLETVSEIGNVISRSENVEDVTLAYVDIESHRDALRTEQKRLMELLEQAESMEDILIIEDRLTTVRYQLETMESQLRTYDNKVDFSTVHLHIQEVKELTPVKDETVLERIANGFMDNLRDVGEGLLDFLIWLIIHIPNLLLIAAIIAGITWIIKLIIRRHRKKKAAKAAKKAQTAQAQVQMPPAQGGSTENRPMPEDTQK